MRPSFDMDYRPDQYWDTPQEVFTNIKGTVRRQAVKEAIEAGRIDEIPDKILEDTLDDSIRHFAGQINPSFMGGEYLPDYLPGEVEIARVELQSVTCDVFSVRARPLGRMIDYRVVDEYMDDPEFSSLGPGVSRSRVPLSMRRLVYLINHSSSWCDLGLVFGPLELNYPHTPAEKLREFVTVSSPYYPELWDYFETKVENWHRRVVLKGLPAFGQR